MNLYQKLVAANEMVNKIRKAFDLQISANRKTVRAYVLDTSVYDGDDQITRFYSAAGNSIDEAVAELFQNLSLHTMHKIVIDGFTTRTERWYFNNDTQEFEQYTIKEA